MPYVTVSSGHRIYCKRVGQGPPLLLIMGTGLDHACWDAQVEAYKGSFECIALDNRGTGKTDAPEGPMSIRLLAEDAVGLVDALGIDRIHVSGLSMGSCIAQEFALMRPDLVETLQLHGTWARAYGYAERKFRAQIHIIEAIGLRGFYEISLLWFMTPEYMSLYPERVAERIDSMVKTAPTASVLIEQYRANLGHDTLDRLPKIEAPTLVTAGSFDLALPSMYSREVAEAVPNANLVVFEGGGHLHNMERPEEFNRVTLDFLRRHVL